MSFIAKQTNLHNFSVSKGVVGVRPGSREGQLIQDFRAYLQARNFTANELTYEIQKYADALVTLAHGINRTCSIQTEVKSRFPSQKSAVHPSFPETSFHLQVQ